MLPTLAHNAKHLLFRRARTTTEYISFSVYRTSAAELPASSPQAQELPASREQQPQPASASGLDFDDAQTAFGPKSSAELAKALAVFSLCGIRPFVTNADAVLKASRSVLGDRATDWAMKQTFFGHFCAGETEQDIQPRLAFLRRNGISGVLNYAVEDDVGECSEWKEAACDANMGRFLDSIAKSDVSSARGFMAIKVSALACPELLQKLSAHLTAVGDDLDRGRCSADLRATVAPALSQAQLQAFDRLTGRLHTIASAAKAKGNMRCMVDAEQSYMQPVMDALTMQLQQTYNRGAPVIFGTYQCYLKSTVQRLGNDMARAAREGWTIGLKTVRGAYMVQERHLALLQGQPCPVHDTAQATHDSYNRCVEMVLGGVAQGRAELMVATHNQRSVELAVAAMQRLGIPPTGHGVAFGTLLGMADHLAFTLGPAQYGAYKMVPYGGVKPVTKYLLRRAIENSDVLGGCAKEQRMIRSELKRRMLAWASFKRPGTTPAMAAA